jgi:hypothetical protein
LGTEGSPYTTSRRRRRANTRRPPKAAINPGSRAYDRPGHDSCLSEANERVRSVIGHQAARRWTGSTAKRCVQSFEEAGRTGHCQEGVELRLLRNCQSEVEHCVAVALLQRQISRSEGDRRWIGSAGSSFAGSTTPTISSALSSLLASLSSSNDFETGSNYR